MNHWRVLIIEDDPDGQEVLASLLHHHNIAVDLAATAEDALVMLARHSDYRAALVDLALPGMDGFTLLHTLQHRGIAGTMPCIAMTAFHSPELAVKAVEAGFTAYFPKPLDTGTFVEELQRVLL
jgi:CheY-like chemotaxis protein